MTNMFNIRFRQVIFILIVSFLLCPQLAVAIPPAGKDPSQKRSNQKRKIQKKEKAVWCGTAYDNSTVCVESQVFIEQKTDNVILGQAMRRVTPGYPMQARAQRIEGNVIVEAVISRSGEVLSIKSVTGPAELIGASREAAKKWRFTPTTVKGEPSEAVARITMKYDLGLEKK